MLVKRITACTHLTLTVSQQLNPKVQKFAILALFLHILASPGTIVVNVTLDKKEDSMLVKRIAAYANANPSIFNRLRAI